MHDQGVPGAPTAAQRLGLLMRQDRDARRLRQADVADALHVERSNVSQLETGARLPSPDYVRRWQALYGPNPALQGAYQAALRDRAARVSIRKARRDAATMPALTPAADGSADGPATIDATGAIVRALSNAARSSIELAWNLWQTDGDATALDGLTTIIGRLEQAITASRGELRRHALRLLGYAHEALGKRAFDNLRYTDAIGHFRELYEFGTELADPDLTTLAMLHLGDVARRRGRYATSVELLDASQAHATAATITTQGRRWQTLARAHAECGHRSLFLHAIDQAQACAEADAAEASDPDGQPQPHAVDFTATEVRHERAHGLTLLGDARTALTIYEASEPTMAFRGARDRANFLIIKAQALAHSGNLDEGVRLAIQGLDLARGYGSPRLVSRVQRMHDRLQHGRYSGDPHVAMLADALAA
jgi:transcriptional regulator with XRE-family HTH domain